MGVADDSALPAPEGSHLHPSGRVKLQGASGKSTERLDRGGSSPSSRFAGLSSTIRGHSHPTMRKEVEKGGEARPLPHTAAAAAAITGFHIQHKADEKLYTQLERAIGAPCNSCRIRTDVKRRAGGLEKNNSTRMKLNVS